jgi:hypothetical protein
MKRLYDMVKQVLKPLLPDGVYFLTSRAALSEKYKARRENYMAYFNGLGLPGYRRMFVFDIGTKGTTVSKFEEVFGEDGKRAELLCFCTFNISKIFAYPEKTHSWLGDCDYYSLPYAFSKYYELFEIISAPEQTQFLYFDDDIRPVFADLETENQKQWGEIARIQEHIIRRLADEIKYDTAWHSRDSDAGVADVILSMLSSETAAASEDIKAVFVFESHYENVEQTNWWERIVF